MPLQPVRPPQTWRRHAPSTSLQGPSPPSSVKFWPSSVLIWPSAFKFWPLPLWLRHQSFGLYDHHSSSLLPFIYAYPSPPWVQDHHYCLFWPSPQLTVCTKATDQMGWRGQLKRIKYEIRLGEPNRPMSTGPMKVKPILYVGPLTERRPRLAHQVSDSWKLALQGEDLLHKEKTCSTRRRLAPQGKDLLCKDETCSTRKGGKTSLL